MEKEDVLVTIVTPSYNQGQFIEDTIKSVLNQTYKNIQYIVVDGASTDNTMEVVERYRDKIDIIISEKDKGQTDAINKGFKLAKGELVGWINSDDMLYPYCVEEIVKLYKQHPDGAIFYGSRIEMIDSKNNHIRFWDNHIKNRKRLLTENYDVSQQGSFYKRDIVHKVNYLDESIYYCMDLDLFLKLLKFGDIYSIDDKPLAQFRLWEEAKTATGKIKFIKNIRERLYLYDAKIYNKSILTTYYWQIRFILTDIIKAILRIK
ncbi:MAG: glycosyltransferase [Bacteroidales bacterium]|nr:glycosyltransferase [Bacteroidales bacterium]